MKVLVVGSGGREHAIIWKLSQSKKISKLYAAPGNGGISLPAETVDIKAVDIEGIVEFSKQKEIDLVVVAPDDPLVLGMVDSLEQAGIRAFGPRKNAAAIEGSKVFAKQFMKKYNIPTADFEIFDNSADAIEYIANKNSYPIVIKADGLALGKGVIIAKDFSEASSAINSIMTEKVFGSSGDKIVIESYETGPEVSILAFVDGKTIKPMVSVMDHKRAYDQDKGPNTGGMGTVSPNPFYTADIAKKCIDSIFVPTINGLNSEGIVFKGCLFFGLMITRRGPIVIEYNARFGDPETQVVLPRLNADLLEIFEACVDGKLDKIDISWSDKAAACVIMASGGYPLSYQTGYPILGLDQSGCIDGCMVFHAGTKRKNNGFVTSGGRVLGVTALGESLQSAINNAYAGIEKISFENAFFRKDIGKKTL